MPTNRYVRVNATADGDNEIIAAPGASGRVVIVNYLFMVDAAGTISAQDTAGTPGILAQFPLAANGGAAFAGTHSEPALRPPTGLGFEINNPAGVNTTGHLLYFIEDV